MPLALGWSHRAGARLRVPVAVGTQERRDTGGAAAIIADSLPGGGDLVDACGRRRLSRRLKEEPGQPR
jgi:hypothetical protein